MSERERRKNVLFSLLPLQPNGLQSIKILNKWQEGVQVLPARNVVEPISQIGQMRAPNDLPTFPTDKEGQERQTSS